MIVNGMVVLMDFREDGVTPYMLFWKDGLQEEKVVSTVCEIVFWRQNVDFLTVVKSFSD